MRSISWHTYVAAFVISVVLFSFGILVGVYLTQSVNQGLEQDLDALKSRTGEMELLLLLNASQDSLCSFYQTQLREFDRQTTDFGSKLDLLEKTRGRTNVEVQKLKKEYMVQQIRDFLLVQRINSVCVEHIPAVLFFYTNQCEECTRQGLVGPPLKRKHPDVMIYAFDVDLKTPAVQALEKLYAVRIYPTLVINGKSQTGFQSEEKIEELLQQTT